MMTNNRKFRIYSAYEMHCNKYDEHKKDMLHAKSRLNSATLFGFSVMPCEERDNYRHMLYIAKRHMKRRLAMIHRLEMLYPDLCMR